MPWKTVWKDPDLFMKYKNVKVYHAYKDDDYDQELSFWYAVYPNNNFNCPCEFDIRMLNKDTSLKAEDVIKWAIDHGYLTDKGLRRPD